MAEYFKQEIADLNGTGRKQYRYEIRSRGNIDLAMLCERLHRRYRTVETAELCGIVENLLREMLTSMAEGYSVTLGRLGSFSLGIGLRHATTEPATEEDTGTDTEREPNARSLCVRNIRFKAGRDFVRQANLLCKLRREEGGSVSLRTSPFTPEERMRRATDYVRAHGFIRIGQYATLNDLSPTAASRELRRMCSESQSALVADGRGPSKVYRLR